MQKRKTSAASSPLQKTKTVQGDTKQKKVWKSKKPEKVFYASTPKKILEKRNTHNELIGVYKQLQGFGFVDRVDEKTGEKKGYFVHESKKLDAFEGDEVAFEVQVFRGKEEATIKKVLKRSEHLVIGLLKMGKTFGFVIPKNKKIEKDIFIPGKYMEGFRDGAMVAVKILKWEGKNPEGRIVEILDDVPEGRRDIYEIAFEMGARKSFPEKVMQELSVFSKIIPQSELQERRDMTQILTFTIDGAESKDLDDAISIEKTSSGYRLGVHIADVAHYVTESSELDREARKRATSIYLVDQVIPMLPAGLSNGLCSLHPGEKKLTLTCEIELDNHGNVIQSQVYESFIESDFRLTYEEIDEIVLGNISLGDTLQFSGVFSPELQISLMSLKELSDILEKKSTLRGSLNFDFPETKIILDDMGIPLEYKKYERYNSYKIIEVCMVLANECVAKQFSKIPFLYRVHEDPNEEDIEKFQKLLESITIQNASTHQLAGKIHPRQIQELLAYLQADPKLEGLQKLVLRSMAKAKYSEKNLGHFGLALQYYSHFTSPIRRYADLQIHRIIKESLSKKYTPERRLYYIDILPKVAFACSEKSQQAEKMEYRVHDMLACKYMQDKIGEVFIGKISGIIDKGFFIELENTIEGFIDASVSGYDSFKEKFIVMQQKTGATLQFGDTLSVKVRSVERERMRVEFEMV